MRRAWQRLLALVHRDRIDRELDEDVRAHLELAERDARAAGLSPDAARRDALRRFGAVESMKEAHRDVRGLPWFGHLVRDIRYGLRAMRRNPRFAAVAVLTLALGIGANTAIFSVVYAVLLRPLPYREADRLVTIASSAEVGGREHAMALSYPDYRDIGALTDAVAGIAAYSTDRYNLTGTGEPREVEVARTTADLLEVLGVSPVMGRDFSVSDDRAPVAIIAHALWRSRFGGDAAAVGRTLSLDGMPFTIIGVMPAAFAFPNAATELWIPIGWTLAGLPPAVVDMRMFRALSTVARLAPGASLETLRGDLDLLGQRISASGEATSKTGTGETFAATLLRDRVVGDAREPLLILFGAVALVLLIACVNAASLLLARANAREKEFAVRRALGAGRWTLVRQLLVESTLLALCAAAAGLALATGSLGVLVARWPQASGVGIDATALGFTAALAIVTGLGFGLVPALRAARPALEPSLRDGAGATAGRPRRRARDVLVIGEVALALVLLVGSALLVRSFVGVSRLNPGFDPNGLLAARIRLTPERYRTATRKRAFFDDLLQRLRTQPDVSAITFTDDAPLAGTRHMVGMNPRRIRPDDPDQFLEIEAIDVGPDFFSTMRIPILQGRAITADDEREGAPPVCVVNKAIAERLWPHQNPIGQVGIGRRSGTVVGVVGDVRSESLQSAGSPAVYCPATDDDRSYDELWVLVRSPHPLRVVPELRAVVHAADPAQPIAGLSTYDAVVQERYASLTLVTALIALFAALALGLAVIGIAGVTAYAVSQRTRELGIRIAIGARAVDVMRLLLRETATLVVIGLGLGLAAAFAVTRTLASLLYGVTSTDPLTFGGAALALGVVALVATYVPARRAGRVNPVEALRSE